VQIEPVPVDDDALMAEAHAVREASGNHDFPDAPDWTLPETLAAARFLTSSTEEHWVARDGGVAVGMHRLRFPLRDNLDTADVVLHVHPDHRGRGIGRALVEHAIDRVRANGRRRIWAEVESAIDGGGSAGERFAAAAGFRPALPVMHRTLDLREPALGSRIDELEEQAVARAGEYRLVTWTGPCPEELLDDFAALNAKMTVDAPMDDLTIEPEVWDADRVREQDALTLRQRRTVFVTAARHGSDGPLVAYSNAAVTEYQPEHAYQWDTLVLREHRGHRLGLLVKVVNLRRLLEGAPQARLLHTWNADSNAHMVAINETLGFRPLLRETEWQLDLV
jgi:GNAT superfamily N-acetyltransferase